MPSSPESKTFFVIKPEPVGSTHETDFLTTDDVVLGDAPRCPVCGHFIGMKVWLPPYKVELALHGKSWGDFAFFAGAGRFIVSSRVADAFTNAGLIGLAGFEPIEVAKVKGRRSAGRPPEYRRVSIARSGAAVDDSRSVIERSEKATCAQCRSSGVDAVHGFTLEPGTWTGEDVFFARGLPGSVLASARFTHLVEVNALTNILAIPTQEYEWDSFAPFSH
jgi:hypothetical protein